VTPLIDLLAQRSIGIVDRVAANEISVLIEPSAPQATALNTGIPTGFPRLNGYLLIPNEAGATVGVVTSVRIERASGQKRRDPEGGGLVDLPFPVRVATLTPLGTLTAQYGEGGSILAFEVKRGVDVFPSVGDIVNLPTEGQLRAIVQGESGTDVPTILLGTSPTAAGAPVRVQPDRLFGRHLAILGNTGAGKSCTVAGVVRWALEQAQDARTAKGKAGRPNARFIVLDPNGEYSEAFKDLGVRVFRVDATSPAIPLKIPAWLWNGEEWASFAGAAAGVQRPLLLEAIRRLRSGETRPDPVEIRIAARVRRYRTELKVRIAAGDHMTRGRREGVAQFLVTMSEDFVALVGTTDQELSDLLVEVATSAGAAEEGARSGSKTGGYWHESFADEALDGVLAKLDAVAAMLGLVEDDTRVSENVPRFFQVSDLPSFVEGLAADTTGRDLAQFVDTLTLRIRGMLAPGPLGSVIDAGDEQSVSLDEWLGQYIGEKEASNGPIAVVDLSLVPSDTVHVVVAVLARMVFEAVQRHRRLAGSELPTVLVLDEAHTFVHKDLSAESAAPAGRLCCRTFERIAREGRKFGLGLVLASQRPSEVSQCNTFLLHRIVNDSDQTLVRKLVPDGLGDLLRELPSLPSRRAILLGWAVPAPVLLEVSELPREHRPFSPDPAFWDVWTGRQDAEVDWTKVAAAWSEAGAPGGEE
jgi:hypothetical protein